jgi:hypothetical protein
MRRHKLIAGKPLHTIASYKGVSLEDSVGKTIEAVIRRTVPSNNGDELCFDLLFTDQTKTGFVVPWDNN